MNELTLVNISFFCNISYCCCIFDFGVDRSFSFGVCIDCESLDFEGICPRDLNFYQRTKSTFYLCISYVYEGISNLGD